MVIGQEMSESGLELHVGWSEARGRWRPTQKSQEMEKGRRASEDIAQHLIQQDMNNINSLCECEYQPVSINSS